MSKDMSKDMTIDIGIVIDDIVAFFELLAKIFPNFLKVNVALI